MDLPGDNINNVNKSTGTGTGKLAGTEINLVKSRYVLLSRYQNGIQN
jgi:hypothetical protein